MPHIILACANGIGEDDRFEECNDELEEVVDLGTSDKEARGEESVRGQRPWNMNWTE